MIFTPRVQRLALLAHVTTSVGWIGAVASFLALALAGVTSSDPQIGRAAYLGMDLTTRFVIVPLGLASPLTGLVSSLGTPWGVFRYYWVLVKVVMTIPASIILLIHTQAISLLARTALDGSSYAPDLNQLRYQLTAAAAAAIVVLLAITALSVYKPRGRTGLSF